MTKTPSLEEVRAKIEPLAALETLLLQRAQEDIQIAKLAKEAGFQPPPTPEENEDRTPWVRSRDDVVAKMGPHYERVIAEMRPPPTCSMDVETKFGFWAAGGGQRAITNAINRVRRLKNTPPDLFDPAEVHDFYARRNGSAPA